MTGNQKLQTALTKIAAECAQDAECAAKARQALPRNATSTNETGRRLHELLRKERRAKSLADAANRVAADSGLVARLAALLASGQ